MRDEPLRERLAEAKDHDDVVRILGKRRMFAYAVAAVVLGLAATGWVVFLIVAVATRARSGWTLLLLPPILLVIGFSALFSYASVHLLATGQRWSGGDGVGKIVGLLNNTDVWPRRRHRR